MVDTSQIPNEDLENYLQQFDPKDLQMEVESEVIEPSAEKAPSPIAEKAPSPIAEEKTVAESNPWKKIFQSMCKKPTRTFLELNVGDLLFYVDMCNNIWQHRVYEVVEWRKSRYVPTGKGRTYYTMCFDHGVDAIISGEFRSDNEFIFRSYDDAFKKIYPSCQLTVIMFHSNHSEHRRCLCFWLDSLARAQHSYADVVRSVVP